jgi:hypothetical protein
VPNFFGNAPAAFARGGGYECIFVKRPLYALPNFIGDADAGVARQRL